MIDEYTYTLPKFLRDELTVDEEELINMLIQQSFRSGYDQGYADAFADYATTETVNLR